MKTKNKNYDENVGNSSISLVNFQTGKPFEELTNLVVDIVGINDNGFKNKISLDTVLYI